MATPKSKGSKQKVRRWSFQVTAKRNDAERMFEPPALTIGNMASARAAADQILADCQALDQFKDAELKVDIVGHETVSQTVLNQINGLEDQAKLLVKALKQAATLYVLSCNREKAAAGLETLEGEEFDKEVTTLIGQLVMDEHKKLQDEKLIALGIDPSQIVAGEAIPEDAIPEDFVAQPAVAEIA